jgi:hypothetical protein
VDIDGDEHTERPLSSGAQLAPAFSLTYAQDDFSAVNAYYNCDPLFFAVESWGFKRDEYFSCTTFPIAVRSSRGPNAGHNQHRRSNQGNVNSPA